MGHQSVGVCAVRHLYVFVSCFFESCEAGGSFMHQGRASLTSAWLLTASLGCYRDWFACIVLQHSRIVIFQALLLQLQPLDSFIEAVLLRLPPQRWG